MPATKLHHCVRMRGCMCMLTDPASFVQVLWNCICCVGGVSWLEVPCNECVPFQRSKFQKITKKIKESAWLSLLLRVTLSLCSCPFLFLSFANEEELSFQSGPNRGLTLTTCTMRRVFVPHYRKLGSSAKLCREISTFRPFNTSRCIICICREVLFQGLSVP